MGKEVVKVSEVSKSYCTDSISVDALVDVSLSIEAGTLTAILGRSGSGKSTLLNLIGGLDQPDSGIILLEGKDIYKCKEDERTFLRRKEIGFVFQSYHLIPVLTVEENIKLPQIEEDGKYVDELLKTLDLYERRKHFPNQLSGGQQQRTAIARALVNHPKVILADEPTGNLDSKTEKIVIDTFKELIERYHTTIVLITHNENIAEEADKILRIEDGKLL